MAIATHSWKRKIAEQTSLLQPGDRIRRQIDGVEMLLNMEHRARVLDLGCGSGCQTLELARRQYRVIGVDESTKALASARDQARAEQLTVHFLSHDMRSLSYDDEFNVVVNIRNPIGCYPQEKDDAACLAAAAKALKHGGRLFLDLLNREWVMRRLSRVAHGDKSGQAFDLRSGRLDCSGFRTRGKRVDALGRSLRLYTLTEVLHLTQAAGLTFRRVYGDYDGRSYGVDSLRMIVIAEKVKVAAPPKGRLRDGLERALRIKGRPR